MLVTIVDACLRNGHGGSPTAVLWDLDLTDAERRQVPQLAGTSHAVFISSVDAETGPLRASLRFFTATGELPACGHGTVAALAFLAQETGEAHYRVTLCASGRSFAGEAKQDSDKITAAFDPGNVELRAATDDECTDVLDALGRHLDLVASEIYVASAGRPRLLVPILSRAALAVLNPDCHRLRVACDRLGLLGCYVYSVPDRDGRLAARMFAPSIGVPEDIANANSSACLAARLAQQNLPRITVEMGDSVGTPATITATTRRRGSELQVRVGGTARVAGELRFPASRIDSAG